MKNKYYAVMADQTLVDVNRGLDQEVDKRSVLAVQSKNLTTRGYKITQNPRFMERVGMEDPNKVFWGDITTLHIGDEIWQLRIDEKTNKLELEVTKNNGEPDKLVVRHNPNQPGNPDSSIFFEGTVELEMEKGKKYTVRAKHTNDSEANNYGTQLLERFDKAVDSSA